MKAPTIIFFLRGVDETLQITKELAKIIALHDTISEDVFQVS